MKVLFDGKEINVSDSEECDRCGKPVNADDNPKYYHENGDRLCKGCSEELYPPDAVNVGADVYNGRTLYFVIAVDGEPTDPKKVLLRRMSDHEIVIASGPIIFSHDGSIHWRSGQYFGRNLLAAVREFYGDE